MSALLLGPDEAPLDALSPVPRRAPPGRQQYGNVDAFHRYPSRAADLKETLELER